MKLCFAPTSPYVRKCLVVAHETGLIGRIEIVPVNPWRADSPIVAVNPLGKVPALVTDDGAALFDSRVVCEYLDSLHDGRKLFPLAAAARWRALAQAALGEGILDAADSRIMESRRPPGTRMRPGTSASGRPSSARSIRSNRRRRSSARSPLV